jgi:Tol biopolymer transport system component
MKRDIFLCAAAGALATLACDGPRSHDPSTLTAPSRAGTVELREHGGGPPGSIVFYSRRGGTLAKIYTMNADGSGVRALTDGPGNDLWPDLAPDGRHIAFASTRSGNSEIYVLDLADGTLTNVSNNAGDDSWPRWSPNGREIVFHSNRDGNYNIFVVKPDASGLRRITTDAALDQWLDWSPDGQRVAFRRGNDVYVADATDEEQNVRRLTFVPATIDQMPAWSPNGQQIAFMSLREGYCAVFLMNADGSEQVNLTPKGATDAASSWCSRAPSWSRNGQQIYFMSFRPSTGGDVEIFAMNADGRELTRLTTSTGEDGGPRAR